MRVIAGSAKGHRLEAPRGSETRPTSDKVREAIFDILAGWTVEGPVLDLFAGSGGLGIEALSRGATEAVFVERRRPACEIIRRNLKHTGFEASSRTLCMPVERALPLLEGSFSLVLLDPPYALSGLHDIMQMVCAGEFIGDETLVVLEHTPRFAVLERYARLVLQRQKVYGDTAVSIFAVLEEEDL
jgi:16S rRNA (guanine(966)-N(2))-methyltransferase RsmD